MLRKFAAASVIALALPLGSAFAADLPSIKGPPPPPPPPPPLWTGFYVGLNAGYTWSNSNTITTSAYPIDADIESPGIAGSVPWSVGAHNDGFIGGGQVGYNYQFSPSFVVGIEADIQGIAGGSSRTGAFGVSSVFLNDTGVTTSEASRRLDYLGTVRGRLGWLFTPTLLLYGTGGLAYGGVNFRNTLYSAELEGFFGPANSTGFGAISFSDTRVGWTAGGGVEWMFLPNWSAKVEYLYYDLGTVAVAGPYVPGFNVGTFVSDWNYAAETRARFDGHIVRAGVNYHFNWGAPVVAKY